jgi:hypothetical protein
MAEKKPFRDDEDEITEGGEVSTKAPLLDEEEELADPDFDGDLAEEEEDYDEEFDGGDSDY